MSPKSNRYCSVPQCSNYASESVHMFLFPQDKQLAQKWKAALKIGKPISKYMYVCSDHFASGDFTISTPNRQRLHLKKRVVPSKKIPVTSHQQTKNPSRRAICKWLEREEDEKVPFAEPIEVNSVFDDVDCEERRQQVPKKSSLYGTFREPISCSFEDPPSLEKTFEDPPSLEKTFEDKSTQTDFSNFQLHTILTTDEKLNHFTGVTYSVIKSVADCVQLVQKSRGLNPIINIYMKLILVLVKLRLSLSFCCLAILFGVSLSTCTRHFSTLLPLIAAAVKPIIYWPSKDEIRLNMPNSFKKFRKTRVVLDCTEVMIQKCKCLKCKIKTYSHYKRTHTFKWLVGITPSGLISYVSSGYGGRASDKAIFNKEGIINKCEPGDAIMVDKGFMIENECDEALVTLYRPPFLRKKIQFSKHEAEMTADIARARVHVERAIQRLKLFNILTHKIEWNLQPHMDYIMTIIAALVNLSPPILADDKFECCSDESEYNVL